MNEEEEKEEKTIKKGKFKKCFSGISNFIKSVIENELKFPDDQLLPISLDPDHYLFLF